MSTAGITWIGRAAGRLLEAALVIAGACTLVFLAMNWLPGDPARQRLGLGASPAQVAAERARLGLDSPVQLRLGRWFAQLLHGDLGRSWITDRPVWASIDNAAHNSAWLVGAALIITVPLLGGIAIACGLRPGGLVDRAVLGIGALGSAVPSFIVAVLLLLAFSARLRWLPALSSPDPSRSMLTQLNLLVLPVATLIISLIAYLVQVVRAHVISVAASPFVEAARLRGVSRRALVLRHLLPSVLPVLAQLAAITVIALTTETVVVEVVFGYPGLGTLLQSAATSGDLPVVQGIALTLATVVVLATALSGWAASALDPHHPRRAGQR